MVQRSTGKIKIIGGKWKRSVINFNDADGLRPTGNRQRETLFNWLSTQFENFSDKRCLDAFAGTGALSFEALSRGFDQAVLFEKNRKSAQAITENAKRIGAEDLTVITGDFLKDFDKAEGKFDLIFLDPPFAANLYSGAVRTASKKLRDGGLLYVESPKQLPEDLFTDNRLEIIRQNTGPAICMTLARKISNLEGGE